MRSGEQRPLALLLVLALAACSRSQASIDPVAWWHGLEGGPIAAQRPPPPGADAPYPNLATVPPRPPPIDPAMRARVYAGLAADRADATYEAQQAPLAPPPPKAPNGFFAGAAPPPPPPADNAGATLEAAEKPPPPPTPPPPAPVQPPAPVRANLLPDTPIADAAVADTPAPTIPDAPPPPPRLPGVVIPVIVPHLPPKAPPPPPAVERALAAGDRAPVGIAFTPGSAVLPTDALAPLRTLAARRGSHAIEIVGFGETDATDALSQIAGIRLGVDRARAIAVALQQDGVPITAIHLAADAPGRGAAARLID